MGSSIKTSLGEYTGQIRDFVEKSSGLEALHRDGDLEISQKADGKTLVFPEASVGEVLARVDSDGKDFLQVNFLDGRKILLTEKLVGFKPALCGGLDMEKLPKVVTTPDLVSVVDAIEESMNGPEELLGEVEVLKKVFHAVLMGGEEIGFDLSAEKDWIARLSSTAYKASA